MEKNIVMHITKCIEHIINVGNGKKIVIYPCGEIGIQVINIMKNIYSIEPAYLIDNHKCKYTNNIHDVTYLKNINTNEYILFLASMNPESYGVLKESALKYFSEDNIVDFKHMIKTGDKKITICGKYSYGPLCNHVLVESVGAFCSFNGTADVVTNHPVNYISTHPFLYNDGKKMFDAFDREKYEDYEECPWYFPGVKPHAQDLEKLKIRRIRIGNDVWLAKDVIITNGANIGNGVIAAAGAVITKDVPDYAVVAGVPARIIRYRYTMEQIEALNKIEWWNWSDDEIRERYDDFYLPIEEFIEKYQ